MPNPNNAAIHASEEDKKNEDYANDHTALQHLMAARPTAFGPVAPRAPTASPMAGAPKAPIVGLPTLHPNFGATPGSAPGLPKMNIPSPMGGSGAPRTTLAPPPSLHTTKFPSLTAAFAQKKKPI